MFNLRTIMLAVVLSLTTTVSLLAYDTNVLSSEKSRVSYAIGMSLGANWKRAGLDVNDDMMLRGLKDEQSGGGTLMNRQEMAQTLHQYMQELAEKAHQEMLQTNQEAAEAFLAENKKRKGVVTLPDGLQYRVIAEGTGPSPAPDDMVTISYAGRLLDGTKLDSSDNLTVQVAGVGRIWGVWREAISRMKAGSQWEIFIPPNLAYGSRGMPPKIGPYAVVIYTIKLLSIGPPHASATQPTTSDIIEVPSAEAMKKGAKVKIIKSGDVPKAQGQSRPAK